MINICDRMEMDQDQRGKGWEGRKERKIRDAYRERGNFHGLYSSYYASILPSDDAILHVGTCPQCDH